jgi:hypothetical protein
MDEDLRGLMYTQSMETFRSFLTNGIQAATLLLVAFTTIVGFAIRNQSWGLLVADLLLLLALMGIEVRVLNAAKNILTVARACERRDRTDETPAPGSSGASLADTLRDQLPDRRPWWKRYVSLLILGAIVLHVAVTIWLVQVEHWTFEGTLS